MQHLCSPVCSCVPVPFDPPVPPPVQPKTKQQNAPTNPHMKIAGPTPEMNYSVKSAHLMCTVFRYFRNFMCMPKVNSRATSKTTSHPGKHDSKWIRDHVRRYTRGPRKCHGFRPLVGTGNCPYVWTGKSLEAPPKKHRFRLCFSGFSYTISKGT